MDILCVQGILFRNDPQSYPSPQNENLLHRILILMTVSIEHMEAKLLNNLTIYPGPRSKLPGTQSAAPATVYYMVCCEIPACTLSYPLIPVHTDGSFRIDKLDTASRRAAIISHMRDGNRALQFCSIPKANPMTSTA